MDENDSLESGNEVSGKLSRYELVSEDPRCEYLLAEVGVFNNRVVWYLEQQQKQEVFALGASGALWAYIFQNNNSFSIVACFIPALITIVLLIKSRVMTKSMEESMSYLKELEKQFELPTGLGWQHFYSKNTSNYKRKWRNFFWIGLVTINVIILTFFLVGVDLLPQVKVTEKTSAKILVLDHESTELTISLRPKSEVKRVLLNGETNNNISGGSSMNSSDASVDIDPELKKAGVKDAR